MDDIKTASRDELQVLQPNWLLPGTVRTMRRIEKITGRTDAITIPLGVDLFSTQVEEIELRIPALATHFQPRLTHPHRCNQLAIHVEDRIGTTVHDAASAHEEVGRGRGRTAGTQPVDDVPGNGIGRPSEQDNHLRDVADILTHLRNPRWSRAASCSSRHDVAVFGRPNSFILKGQR